MTRHDYAKCSVRFLSRLFLAATVSSMISITQTEEDTIQTEHVSLEVSDGFFTSFIDKISGKSYGPAGQQSSVLTIRCEGKDHTPSVIDL